MEGEGRLAEVEDVVAAALELGSAARGRDLAGLKLLVTAGPTVEDIDPVRFVSNRSSGRMGYAVAAEGAARGAEVHLVSGPTHLTPPPGVAFVPVRSAAEMKAAVLDLYPAMDIVVKAAAVSDYRPARYSPAKIKKQGRAASLDLEPNEDILALLGAAKARQVLVGFAAETDDLLANAQAKLAAKNLDLIVANDVGAGVFGSDSATVHIIDRAGEAALLTRQPKSVIARRLLDRAARLVVR
jgi:phosphopantothenoylcysteine decarboxylase/phosphopantothenate--cysteine ligase